MNTPHEETNVVENSAYNPFPEPQTIPAGWDLSGMFSVSQIDMLVDEAEAEKGIQVNK
jgi:uncharacterized protein YbdZ (MbtH family)